MNDFYFVLIIDKTILWFNAIHVQPNWMETGLSTIQDTIMDLIWESMPILPTVLLIGSTAFVQIVTTMAISGIT